MLVQGDGFGTCSRLVSFPVAKQAFYPHPVRIAVDKF
jgi:hypothetical protein